MTVMCIAAANYLIEKTNEYNKGRDFRNRIRMSGKRLQKLLYFSDIEYMKRYNTPMLRDNFYAWPSGPVIPSVYIRFIQYQSGESSTIGVDTSKLVKASHAEGGPWDCVYNAFDKDHDQIVEKKKMREFYKDMNVKQMLQL